MQISLSDFEGLLNDHLFEVQAIFSQNFQNAQQSFLNERSSFIYFHESYSLDCVLVLNMNLVLLAFAEYRIFSFQEYLNFM